MISLDRQPVTPERNLVRCPLRDRDVAVERCLGCALLIDRDPIDPPRYVVCDARVVTGWLGLDQPRQGDDRNDAHKRPPSLRGPAAVDVDL